MSEFFLFHSYNQKRKFILKVFLKVAFNIGFIALTGTSTRSKILLFCIKETQRQRAFGTMDSAPHAKPRCVE